MGQGDVVEVLKKERGEWLNPTKVWRLMGGGVGDCPNLISVRSCLNRLSGCCFVEKKWYEKGFVYRYVESDSL